MPADSASTGTTRNPESRRPPVWLWVIGGFSAVGILVGGYVGTLQIDLDPAIGYTTEPINVVGFAVAAASVVVWGASLAYLRLGGWVAISPLAGGLLMTVPTEYAMRDDAGEALIPPLLWWIICTATLLGYGPGEGHDQFVDDMFTTPNGKYLAVSRPSFADVVWIDIAKAIAKAPGAIVHEEQMDGFRTDHMGLSPNGKRLLVSDSTSRTVHEYSMVNQALADGTKIKLGQRLRTFESGETPHESNYSKDGKRIFHASIGRVYTPGDDLYAGPVKIGPLNDAIKGDRWFEIVRNADFSILKRWDMGKELAEAGYPGMSSAVRPMAIAPGERFIYFQVSYFHGIVEFDTQAPDLNGKVDYKAGTVAEPRTGAVTRLINLPNRVPTMPLQNYVNDSAHHGLSIDTTGKTLCAAGTMDDYVALVNRSTGGYRIYDEKTTGHSYAKPYWTTEGPGDRCWISLSEADAVAVIDFATGKELAHFPVGDHPQRIRHGWVPEALVKTWTNPDTEPTAPTATDPLTSLLGGLTSLLGLSS